MLLFWISCFLGHSLKKKSSPSLLTVGAFLDSVPHVLETLPPDHLSSKGKQREEFGEAGHGYLF